LILINKKGDQMQKKKKKLAGRPRKDVTRKMVSIRLYPEEKKLIEKHFVSVKKALDGLIHSLLDKMAQDE
jgi:hypothetical protein